MFSQRLKALCLAVSAWLRDAGAAVWAGVALLVARLTVLAGVIARRCVRALRWLFVPANLTPLDILKHYTALIIVFTGFISLAWAAKQIAYPPLVINVAKLPSQLEQENWINPELSRALMNQIERMRTVVKGERDPAFEAVLDPPNIAIKTGDFSLNVQEQILTPLGFLLGRGQGEVHMAVSCYQPNCARTRDNECTEVVSNTKPGESKAATETQFLCLRLTTDIRRGAQFQRLTQRLTLSTDTYDIDLARQMSRIAEAVTSIADPATAALYFYRRVRQEEDAVRSLTNDPDAIAQLRGEAFRAAEQAEAQDSVSKCWAHTIRAHLAIDRREFSLAEVYLTRAGSLTLWDHLKHGTLRSDCERLIAIAEMELARELARPADYPAYPPHPGDFDSRRLVEARNRVNRLLTGLSGDAAAFPGYLRAPIDTADFRSALEFVRSEIGLGWFTQADQCRLLDGRTEPVEADPDLHTGQSRDEAYTYATDEELDRIRRDAWMEITTSVDKLQSLLPSEQLPPLTRQAAMDFLRSFSVNELCTADVQAVARPVYLAHPNDAKMTQLFASMTEAAALKKSRTLDHPAQASDRGNMMLGYAKSIYERLVDVGDDKVDVVALSRLAFITEAFYADGGEEPGQPARIGPVPETLATVTRAWRRYQQQHYPSDTRHHAEFLLAFWGSLLLRFYPDVTTLDLVDETKDADLRNTDQLEQLRSAKANFTEFRRALRALFPGAQATKLESLPKLTGIGPRIGCLCLLSHAVYKNELADFLVSRINDWQDVTADVSKCQNDLIPARETEEYDSTKKAEEDANDKLVRAENAVNEIDNLRKRLEQATTRNQSRIDEARRRSDAAEARLSTDESTPELQKEMAEARRRLRSVEASAKAEIAGLEKRIEDRESKTAELEKARNEAQAEHRKAVRAASRPKSNWEDKTEFLNSKAPACGLARKERSSSLRTR